MRYYTAVIVLLIFAAAVSANAQRRTITNADLEKYRIERLNAEREYRENHARLGLPSPEELAKRSEASLKESMELSARLREQEIERERMRLEFSTSPVVRAEVYREIVEPELGLAPAYFPVFFDPGRDSWRHRRGRPTFRQEYYVSGGSIWPVGARTPSRPMFRLRRR